MSKSKYQIGSLVKIINPKFFVRCGYEKRPIDYIDKVDESKIYQLLREHDLCSSYEHFCPGTEKVVQKIKLELAYLYCKKDGFGGSERKIFTIELENFKGWLFEVVDKKTVVTGFRQNGRYYDDSPSLSNAKVHTLLILNKFYSINNKFERLHIEITNVEPSSLI